MVNLPENSQGKESLYNYDFETLEYIHIQIIVLMYKCKLFDKQQYAKVIFNRIFPEQFSFYNYLGIVLILTVESLVHEVDLFCVIYIILLLW